MEDLSLFGSYTHSTYSYPCLILIAVGSYAYRRRILIQILYIFRSPKGHILELLSDWYLFPVGYIFILMFISGIYLFKSPK